MKLQIFANLFSNEINTASDSTCFYFSSSERALCFLISIVQSLTRRSLALGNISKQLFQKCNDLSICLRKAEDSELQKNTAGDTVAIWSALFIVSW